MVGTNEPNDFSFSRLSAEYVKKMAQLCDTKQVKSFKIQCPFMSDEFCMDDLNEFNAAIKKFALEEYFKYYYDKLVFIDHDLFTDDIHLKNDSIIPEDFLEIAN
jgi:hypothetical protein